MHRDTASRAVEITFCRELVSLRAKLTLDLANEKLWHQQATLAVAVAPAAAFTTTTSISNLLHAVNVSYQLTSDLHLPESYASVNTTYLTY